MESETEKPQITCPKCGAIVDAFLDKGWGRVACPVCGEIFKRDELPPGAEIKRLPRRRRKEEKAEEEEEEERRPPFRRIKTAKELIEEICDKYQVKERAKRIIADWCDRVPGGVLHPAHFEKLLLDLDSGVSKKEATLLAEEYEFALQKAQAEARELGISRPYYYTPTYDISGYEGRTFYSPLVYPPYETRTAWDFYGRTVTPTPPSGPRYPSARPPSYGYYPPPSERLTREDIERIFEERVSKLLEEKRRRDEIESIKEQVANVPKIVEETVSKFVPQLPPNIVTADQLKEILDKKAIEAQLEAQKEQTKMFKELYDKAIDELKATRQEWAKERQEILKRVEESRKPVQISTQGYQRDEVRLLADALQVFGQKSPVKDLGGIFIQFMGKEKQPLTVTKPKEKIGESKITDLLPKEYVEEKEE